MCVGFLFGGSPASVRFKLWDGLCGFYRFLCGKPLAFRQAFYSCGGYAARGEAFIYSSRTESQRISAKPQVAVIFSKPDREPKYGASQGSVKEKPVLVVIHAQMTVTANQ